MITSLSSNYKPLSECNQDTPVMKSRVMHPTSGPGPGGTEMSSISVMSANHNIINHHLNNNNSSESVVDTVVVHHQPDCHVLAKHKLASAKPGDLINSASRRPGPRSRGELVWTNFHCLLCV